MKSTLFTAANFKVLWFSIALLAVGYVLLAQGPVYNPLSWTVAPLILVFVYIVLLPLSVLGGRKAKKEEDTKGV
ncbi:MAG: hypothetical protein GF344_02870 [Chitinivibrionales bacterium]|nr:hypothetical protein [Chitinivibrionales bacterium]MBD3356022.1 hypothetical protein [Chitinivibrionales bacterium]